MCVLFLVVVVAFSGRRAVVVTATLPAEIGIAVGDVNVGGIICFCSPQDLLGHRRAATRLVEVHNRRGSESIDSEQPGNQKCTTGGGQRATIVYMSYRALIKI